MPKVTVAQWHDAAASAVTSWENRILLFTTGTVQALDSGDSASEMRLAREFIQQRDDQDDFGLQDAINELGMAIGSELSKKA